MREAKVVRRLYAANRSLFLITLAAVDTANIRVLLARLEYLASHFKHTRAKQILNIGTCRERECGESRQFTRDC